MSCRFCGTLLQPGTLVCEICGGEQSVEWSARTEPPRQQATPVQVLEVDARPTCSEHAGMPLLGSCPRCQKQVCVRCAPDAVNDVLTCSDCYGLTPAHRPAPGQSFCAVHSDRPARFVCARCGSFACSECRRPNDTSGRCSRCTLPVGELASRGDRFVANLVDHVVVIFLPIAAAIIIGFTAASAKGRDDSDGFFAVLLVVVLGAFAAGLAAQLIAQVSWGQSIGKRLTGIKVVRTDGSQIELWRLLLLRNLVMSVLANAFGLIGLVDALLIFTDARRCIHDYLADSIVVEAKR